MAQKKLDADRVTSAFSELTPEARMIEKANGKRRQQTTASPEEAHERRVANRTRGRKGCRASRMNMAFTPANTEFINFYAAAAGLSKTDACNALIDYARAQPEVYKMAHERLDRLQKANGIYKDLEVACLDEEEEPAENDNAASDGGNEP